MYKFLLSNCFTCHVRTFKQYLGKDTAKPTDFCKVLCFLSVYDLYQVDTKLLLSGIKIIQRKNIYFINRFLYNFKNCELYFMYIPKILLTNKALTFQTLHK